MKKIILFSSSLVWAMLMLFNFSSKKTNDQLNRSELKIVSCLPAETTVALDAVSFKARYGAEPLRVRKDVSRLTQAEINAIKVGIIKMRALPYSDPTSWGYQAAIHGTTMTDNLPSWNMCHRAGEANFFLAWHRMYCYFFERILRAKSGRQYLTLPYWNYQNSPAIPAAYRDKSLGNPLYDATRSSTMNNGGSLPSSIMTAFVNSLNITTFYDFQNNMNGGPHGSVHTSISGNMAVVTTAAKDPVFWLHHSNIDRLWEVWLGKCGGRTNPIDTVWTNKSYTFFDETGTAVNIKGSDIVSIATQLNYRYDSLPLTTSCGGTASKLISSDQLLTKSSTTELNTQMQTTSFTNVSTTKLDAFISKKKRTDFKFADKKNPERLQIYFDGIQIDQLPEGVVEVYLDLPANTKNPSASSKYFAGLLDLFSAQHFSMMNMQGMNNPDKINVDATRAAQLQNLNITDLKNAQVSFFVRGSTMRGTETVTPIKLSISTIQFIVNGLEITQ